MKIPRYPRNFWIICFGLLFFIMSFNIIIPELNNYVKELHPKGKYYLGLTITLFSVSAAISRPYSGKLADHIGRKKVMYIGASIGLVSCLIYPLAGTLSPLVGILTYFFLRLAHGFSAGFLPTGATALVTDILPEKNRGLGMGIWGTFISVGFGAGQLLSSWITNNWGINALFMVAAAFAVITLLVMSQLEETLPDPKKFKREFLRITISDVLERPVMPAAVVMFLSVISTGIVFVITPEISDFLGLNKGWFFGFYVVSTIVVRLFVSSLSDIIGRRKTLIIGQIFMFLSIMTVAISQKFNDAETVVLIYSIGASLFGVSTGISSPTIFAWTADLSLESRRGVGAGTMFIALETGIMVGSISTMITYDNTPDTIFRAFLVGATAALVGIAYLAWHLLKRESKT